MEFKEKDGQFICYLSETETDMTFDKFDITDSSLPSHLYWNGHRYIKESTYEWLVEHVGEPCFTWSQHGNINNRYFVFHNKDHALLFKLTFSSL